MRHLRSLLRPVLTAFDWVTCVNVQCRLLIINESMNRHILMNHLKGFASGTLDLRCRFLAFFCCMIPIRCPVSHKHHSRRHSRAFGVLITLSFGVPRTITSSIITGSQSASFIGLFNIRIRARKRRFLQDCIRGSKLPPLS